MRLALSNGGKMITFTDAASTYIKKMIEKDGAAGFRLTIKKTGCSGYSYAPAVIKAAVTTDTKMELANGATVYLDTTWMHLLEGLTVDYVEEDKAGLKQKRLVFINPNESSRCGCGESFHVE